MASKRNRAAAAADAQELLGDTDQQSTRHFCSVCKYATDRPDHFNRHLASQAHLLTVDTLNMESGQETENPVPSANDSTSTQSLENGSFVHSVDASTAQSVSDFQHPLSSDSENDESRSPSPKRPHIESPLPSTSATEPTEEEYRALAELFRQDFLEGSSEAWFPFDGPMSALSYCLFNGLTSLWSEAQMHGTITLVRAASRYANGPKIPSMQEIKQFELPGYGYFQPVKCTDDKGNDFFVIPPEAVVKIILSHPEWSKTLHRYPVLLAGNAQAFEQNEGSKWFESIITHWHGNMFTSDIVKLKSDAGYMKILRFVIKRQGAESQICTVGKMIEFMDLDAWASELESVLVLNNEGAVTKMIVDIDCVVDIDAIASQVQYIRDQNGQRPITRQELRIVTEKSRFHDEGRRAVPIVNVPLNAFFDKTAGTTSKKMCSVLTVMYQPSGLPANKKQDHNTVFVAAASPDIKPLQILKPIVENWNEIARNGFETFDASLKKMVLATSVNGCFVLDTEMKSKANYHSGHTAKRFCHLCNACYIETDENGEDIVKATTIQQPIKTKQFLEEQIAMCRADGEATQTRISKQFGVKDHGPNYIYRLLGNRGPLDTPFDRLHQLDLGVLKITQKYALDLLGDCNISKALLTSYIEQFPFGSFSQKLNYDVTRYFGSMHGKEFCKFAQIAPFAFYFTGFIPLSTVRFLMKAALLSKLLRNKSPQLCDYDRIADLNQQIATTALAEKKELLRKPKFHYNLHLEEDLQRHGSPLNFTADAFEKCNGFVREMVLHSNRKEMSTGLDILRRECKRKTVQHLLSGGYFLHDGQWRQAGPSVLSLIEQPAMRRLFKLSSSDQGFDSILKAPVSRYGNEGRQFLHDDAIHKNHIHEIDLACRKYYGNPLGDVASYIIQRHSKVSVADSKKPMITGSDVLLHSNEIGQITDILKLESMASGQQLSLICLRPYNKKRYRDGTVEYHEVLQCQILEFDDTQFQYVAPFSLKCHVCLVHNCCQPDCGPNEEQSRYTCNRANNKEYLLNRFRISHPDSCP